jgi:hypothetical protein
VTALKKRRSKMRIKSKKMIKSGSRIKSKTGGAGLLRARAGESYSYS